MKELLRNNVEIWKKEILLDDVDIATNAADNLVKIGGSDIRKFRNYSGNFVGV